MFYDVVTKFKDEPPRVTWTFGSDTNATLEDLLTILEDKDCEYVKLELLTYWRSKRDERIKSI